MAFAETAPLIAALKLDDKFSGPLKNAGKALGTFDAKLDRSQTRAFRAGQQIGTGIKNTARIAAVGVGILVSQVALGLNSLIKLEQAQAQTAAVLKSTGQAAGQTGADITRLSEKFEGLNATVGDEFVRAGANMLLTFTNVRQKAFEPALAAILDMNTAMGKGPEGLTTTAILVGKALNDPIKGATALRRVGVQLSEAQEKQIKTLVKQNDLYGAQQIIIKELNKEFGGSFIAQGNTTAGKVAKFTDSIEDLQRALAEALLPTLGNVADALTKTLADPAVVQGVKDFGKSLADFVSPANLASAGRILQDVFNAAREAAPTVAAAAKTMGAVVKTAVSLFQSLPPEIQKLAIGAFAINKLTGGLVTNIAGGLISSVLKQLVSGVVNVSGAVVNVVGGPGIPGVDPTSKGSLVRDALGIAAFVAKAIAPVIILQQSGAIDALVTNINSAIFGPKTGATLNDQRNFETGGGAGAPLFQGKGVGAFEPGGIFGPKLDANTDALNKNSAALLQNTEIFGPPKPGRFTTGNLAPPSVRDSFRGTPASLKEIEAAMARGRAAGFKPTFASAQETLQRNISRNTEKALGKQEAIKAAILAGDTRSELAGIRNAVSAAGQKGPTTNVAVNVNVTAGGIVKTVTVQKRFGPPVGSRQSDAGHFGGAGT